jgi:hypothetical protein
MHDQPSDRSPAEAEARDDATVLNLLLDRGLGAPLTVEEVVRVVGDGVGVIDAVARLHGDGLIYRCNEFVFATRAARRFAEIET